MADQPTNAAIGSLYHFDLTVPNADAVRDFYEAVVGWTHEPMAMGDYDDYVMKGPDGETWVSGICHARGDNADLPAQWLLYITVADLDASLAKCAELGGRQVSAIKGDPDADRYCVIQDPAGAFMALNQPAKGAA